MEKGIDRAGLKRLAAAVLLATGCFALGYAVGHAPDESPEVPPPEGMELWQTPPPEQLADVADGLMERISELEDDLATVREIQREKLPQAFDLPEGDDAARAAEMAQETP